MGLDNGIWLVTRNKLDEDALPEYISIEYDDWATKEYNNGYYYSLCYWRKCHNIRQIIFEILEEDPNIGNENYILENNHINQLIAAEIYYLCKPNKWEEDYDEGRTIWEFNSMLRQLANDIATLSWVLEYKENHSNIKLIFYDSY